MARQQQYTLGRVFVGDRLLEDLTEEEQAAFRRRTVERMGAVFNNYFSHHPDVYVRICEKYADRDTAQDRTPVTGAACSVAVQEAMS